MKLIKKSAYLLTFIFFMFNAIDAHAQFNENLERQILDLAKKYELDGIEKAKALDRLEAISSSIGSQDFRKNLIGEGWKYSHSVDITGRKYRRSNAVYIYKFSENGEADFVYKNSQAKTWCKWNDEKSNLFELDHFEDADRVKRTRRDYFGIHHISPKRLVLTNVIRSKNFPGKSAILFNVYFRR